MAAIPRRLPSVVVVAAAGVSLAAAAVAAAPDAAPAVASPAHQASVDATLLLTAVCDPGAGEPSAIAVELTLPLTGRPVFRLDDDVYGTPGMANLIADAAAVDQRGALPLIRRIASGPDGARVLELASARDAVGRVTLRYRARSVPVAGDGARYGLRHDATGIGGHGAYFLVLPDSHRDHRVRIDWGRPACPAATGGEGLSSFGETAATADLTDGLDALRMAVYFFGHPRVVAVDDGAVHLRTAWFGDPALDVAAAAAWAARAFAAERALFGDDDPGRYAAFVRVLPAMGARSNGMGQPRSLILAIGPHTPFGPRLRTNLAHEILHRWIGLRLRLAGPEGTSFWLTEGFTVYYANTLLRRAGLISADEFLAELNTTVTRQLANDRSAASNDEIRRRFTDDAVAVVPYTRGALYAAELAAAIRHASHGRRSLDDAIRELYHAAWPAHAGAGLAAGAFRAMVVRELGSPGAARYDAVIVRGGPPDPPSDAFGPCFAREPRQVALFQLGFDEAASRVEPREIRGLIAGSGAARAGLVEGDRLISVESAFLDPDTEAVVTVSRGGRPVAVRYLPAGPRRAGYRWVRVTGIPDQRCDGPGSP